MTSPWRWLGQSLYVMLLPGLRWVVKDSQRTRLLIIHDGQILVVHSWLGDRRWSLPGGGVHTGEPITAGASRELREETGLRLDPTVFQPLASELYTERGFHFNNHYYYAQVATAGPLKPQWLEIYDVAWVKPADLTPANTGADVWRALQLGGEAGLNLVQ